MEIFLVEHMNIAQLMEFAIEGMNLRRYTQNAILLNLYARFFLYLEMQKASRIYSAYEEDKLLGCVMLDMEGERKKYFHIGRQLYVWSVSLLLNLFFADHRKYVEANRQLYKKLSRKKCLDGQINFLAVSPVSKGKGVGSALLRYVSEQCSGKYVYVYTDSECDTYFYDRKGFIKEEQSYVTFEDGSELICMIYSKLL